MTVSSLPIPNIPSKPDAACICKSIQKIGHTLYSKRVGEIEKRWVSHALGIENRKKTHSLQQNHSLNRSATMDQNGTILAEI